MPDLPTMRMKRQRTYDPVGACIYCGTTEGPLTTEHIIPESFGGTLLLPAATMPCLRSRDWGRRGPMRRTAIQTRPERAEAAAEEQEGQGKAWRRNVRCGD
jgi:5-methylcytosine-specific restriction endonuclease McrA